MLSTFIVAWLSLSGPWAVNGSTPENSPKLGIQTSQESQSFRAEFDERTASLVAQLSIDGSLSPEKLPQLARDVVFGANGDELEELLFELIELASSVAAKKADRELALRWLDISDHSQHPAYEATSGKLWPARVGELRESLQAIGRHPEIQAQLASWGGEVIQEPLYTREEALNKAEEIYGPFEGSISQLRDKCRLLATRGSVNAFSMRDASGLYFLALESLGRDDGKETLDPLIALLYVDGATGYKLIQEHLHCGYPQWTRQLLDLWLYLEKGWNIEPGADDGMVRADIAAVLFDDPLGRRAILKEVQKMINRGVYTPALLERIKIEVADNPDFVETFYESGHTAMSSNGTFYLEDLMPLAIAGLNHPKESVRVGAAQEFANVLDPTPLWEAMDPSIPGLHSPLVESLHPRNIKPRRLVNTAPVYFEVQSHRREWAPRSVFESGLKPLIQVADPELLSVICQRFEDMACEHSPLVIDWLSQREDLDQFAESFDQLIYNCMKRGQLGSQIALDARCQLNPSYDPENRTIASFMKILYTTDKFEDEDLYKAWFSGLTKSLHPRLAQGYQFKLAMTSSSEDPEMVEALIEIATTHKRTERGSSLFANAPAEVGEPYRKFAMDGSRQLEDRLAAWCLGWDPVDSPKILIDLFSEEAVRDELDLWRSEPGFDSRSSSGGTQTSVNSREWALREIEEWFTYGSGRERQKDLIPHLVKRVQSVDWEILSWIRLEDYPMVARPIALGIVERKRKEPVGSSMLERSSYEAAWSAFEYLGKEQPELFTTEYVQSMAQRGNMVAPMLGALKQLAPNPDLLPNLSDWLNNRGILQSPDYLLSTPSFRRNFVRDLAIQILEGYDSIEAAQVLLSFNPVSQEDTYPKVEAALARMRERFETRELFMQWGDRDRGRSQTLERLAQLLESDDTEQRVAAIRSLGALAAQEYLPDLILLFADKETDVASAAREAVRTIERSLVRELANTDGTNATEEDSKK